jgi:hypothetical protein
MARTSLDLQRRRKQDPARLPQGEEVWLIGLGLPPGYDQSKDGVVRS